MFVETAVYSFLINVLGLKMSTLSSLSVTWRLQVLFLSGTARSNSVVKWNVVALTDAARWEPEPIREDTSAFVHWIVGKESMEPVLLLAFTSIATVHLLVLVGTFFPVYVLFKRVDIQES